MRKRVGYFRFVLGWPRPTDRLSARASVCTHIHTPLPTRVEQDEEQQVCPPRDQAPLGPRRGRLRLLQLRRLCRRRRRQGAIVPLAVVLLRRLWRRRHRCCRRRRPWCHPWPWLCLATCVVGVVGSDRGWMSEWNGRRSIKSICVRRPLLLRIDFDLLILRTAAATATSLPPISIPCARCC